MEQPFAHGVRRLVLASFAFCSRRRDDRPHEYQRLFPNLCQISSRESSKLNSASFCCVAVTLGFSTRGVGLPACAISLISRRHDVGVATFGVGLSASIPRLICSKYGIVFRRHKVRHRDACCGIVF